MGFVVRVRRAGCGRALPVYHSVTFGPDHGERNPHTAPAVDGPLPPQVRWFLRALGHCDLRVEATMHRFANWFLTGTLL